MSAIIRTMWVDNMEIGIFRMHMACNSICMNRQMLRF